MQREAVTCIDLHVIPHSVYEIHIILYFASVLSNQGVSVYSLIFMCASFFLFLLSWDTTNVWKKMQSVQGTFFSSVSGDTMNGPSGVCNWYSFNTRLLFFLVNNTSHCMVSVRRRSFILPPDRFNTTKGNYKVVEMRLVIKLDFNLPDWRMHFIRVDFLLSIHPSKFTQL